MSKKTNKKTAIAKSRFEICHTLADNGISIANIARTLGISYATARDYMQFSDFKDFQARNRADYLEKIRAEEAPKNEAVVVEEDVDRDAITISMTDVESLRGAIKSNIELLTALSEWLDSTITIAEYKRDA